MATIDDVYNYLVDMKESIDKRLDEIENKIGSSDGNTRDLIKI